MLALLAAALPWLSWLGAAAGAGRGVGRTAVAPRVAATIRASLQTRVRADARNVTSSVGISSFAEPRRPNRGVKLSPLTAVQAVWKSSSFHDFMLHVRAQQGDIVQVDLWPVLPPIYVVMGKAANRAVLSDLDSALEQVPCSRARDAPKDMAGSRSLAPLLAWQVLQDLINVLPVSAKIPSEVDVELQRKVASFFQNVNMVDAQLPRFLTAARSMREGWLET
jgi:hypothetical protein